AASLERKFSRGSKPANSRSACARPPAHALSAPRPWLVVSTVPAVISGVVIALWITGTTLNIQSFMGAIMAVGVAVANSILLVTFAERSRVGEPARLATSAVTTLPCLALRRGGRRTRRRFAPAPNPHDKLRYDCRHAFHGSRPGRSRRASRAPW